MSLTDNNSLFSLFSLLGSLFIILYVGRVCLSGLQPTRVNIRVIRGRTPMGPTREGVQ